MKKHFLVGIGATLLATAAAFATDPGWWTDNPNGTAIIDGNVSSANYVPLNLGQLKNVASKAKLYLDNELTAVGGAGPAVNTMVAGFANNTTLNYQPANLGQLKAVAKPFYDRLLEIGYDTKANLIARGYDSGWAYYYPWNPGTASSVNYFAANLGQLKMVFSFDLSAGGFSTTAYENALANGLPNVWLTDTTLYPFYGSAGATGNASTTYSHLDEYGPSLGHDPQSADYPNVGLLVFTNLQ